ncbi:OmpA family protein [Acidovorax sp.]|uniref:OmpA family protein n=1 Tax=Acidovorax sp. TaxID=1872122 RepID=UPI00260CB5CC|nr:OmpA family protein [Acidovorax sp.]
MLCQPEAAAWRARAVALACVLLAVAAVHGPVHALEVVRSGRALGATPNRLEPTPGAPSTTLRAQEVGGGLVSRSQNTTLQRSAGPQTILREAEVPKERLAQTRALLVELKARPTPEQAISIDLPADVLFDFDKSDLRTDAAASLDKAAELVKSYATAPLAVLGHTDGKGTDAYNDALSLRRAQAVAHALQRQTGRQARVEGLGKRQPVAPNTTPDGRDDPQGRQLNRRVQILIGVPTRKEGG